MDPEKNKMALYLEETWMLQAVLLQRKDSISHTAWLIMAALTLKDERYILTLNIVLTHFSTGCVFVSLYRYTVIIVKIL